MWKSSKTSNTLKITFSSVKNVEIILCSKNQEKGTVIKDFDERVNAQGTRLLFDKKREAESQLY